LNNRHYLINKITRDWPALRYGLKNGRKLNRLSTAQLQAKLRQIERALRKQLQAYNRTSNTFALEVRNPRGELVAA